MVCFKQRWRYRDESYKKHIFVDIFDVVFHLLSMNVGYTNHLSWLPRKPSEPWETVQYEGAWPWAFDPWRRDGAIETAVSETNQFLPIWAGTRKFGSSPTKHSHSPLWGEVWPRPSLHRQRDAFYLLCLLKVHKAEARSHHGGLSITHAALWANNR